MEKKEYLIPSNKLLILFDGVCNLCNSSIQFIIKRDTKNHFVFASLQSKIAQEILTSFGEDPQKLDSIVLFENGKLYKKSTAALRIAKKLKGFWKSLYMFMIVPKFIRNLVYSIIAKNRYKWFGKQESCWLPNPDLKAKFLPEKISV